MNIHSEKPKNIYKYTKDGKDYYSIGLVKKKQDGTYEKGYMTCNFKKDVQLENKTKIYIKEAWIDFWVKDKITHPYIFINKFELADSNTKDEEEDKQVVLKDEDIDKVFTPSELELPF